MQGFGIDPDSVEAHQALRDISMKRKVSGGKSLGMFEAMKLKRRQRCQAEHDQCRKGAGL